MIDTREIVLDRFVFRYAQSDERVKWTPRRMREMTAEEWKRDDRQKCDRCKHKKDKLINAWNGMYCVSCNAEIAERYHKHYKLCGENTDDANKIIRNGGVSFVNDKYRGGCGEKIVVDPELEGRIYDRMGEYEAMTASPCSAYRNDVTYMNGDAATR